MTLVWRNAIPKLTAHGTLRLANGSGRISVVRLVSVVTYTYIWSHAITVLATAFADRLANMCGVLFESISRITGTSVRMGALAVDTIKTALWLTGVIRAHQVAKVTDTLFRGKTKAVWTSLGAHGSTFHVYLGHLVTRVAFAPIGRHAVSVIRAIFLAMRLAAIVFHHVAGIAGADTGTQAASIFRTTGAQGLAIGSPFVSGIAIFTLAKSWLQAPAVGATCLLADWQATAPPIILVSF